jgi:tetratricopeptide (TPR) repeat protein
MEDKSARIAFASALASFFDVSNDADHAVEFQERAIEASRRQGLDREKEQQLSVLLYNYSGYLARAGRLDEAVAALEEVVAIDERWGLEDITSDRAALEQMRQRRDGVAEAPDDIPPEMAEQLQQMMRQFEQMGESEREALVLAARRERIKQQAEQVVGVALQATRDGRLDDLLPQLAAAAAHYAEDEEPGSPYDQLAAFVRAVAARLRGNPALPVPPTYVERYAAFEEALGTRSAE